jgi:hypothetical protein
MNWREMAHRLPFALAAVAGAVLGHALTYLVTVPNADARAEVLAGTGHGYWPLAVATAVALSLLSAGTTITRRFLAGLRRAPRDATPGGVAPRIARLALLQVAIYLVQEVTERIAAGAPVSGLAHTQLLVGVVVQMLVAGAVAAVLLGLGRAAEAAGRALTARVTPAADRSAGHWPTEPRRAWRLLGGALAIRAPPAA